MMNKDENVDWFCCQFCKMMNKSNMLDRLNVY